MTPQIHCEILAPVPARADALAEIAAACGRDVGVPLAVDVRAWRERAKRQASPSLTLHLPADLAASQHEVWCLACRLACFCPSARVSVLVLGTDFAAAESCASQSTARSA